MRFPPNTNEVSRNVPFEECKKQIISFCLKYVHLTKDDIIKFYRMHKWDREIIDIYINDPINGGISICYFSEPGGSSYYWSGQYITYIGDDTAVLNENSFEFRKKVNVGFGKRQQNEVSLTELSWFLDDLSKKILSREQEDLLVETNKESFRSKLLKVFWLA